MSAFTNCLSNNIYVNVQGDEPMVDPDDIRRCIELKIKQPDCVINGYCWIGPDENAASVNIPKVITKENNLLIYMSRGLVPSFKNKLNAPHRYKKQVCIYGFSQGELDDYSNFARKSILEYHEDIEILRFLELDKNILMFECAAGSLAVDVPEDVHSVEALLSA